MQVDLVAWRSEFRSLYERDGVVDVAVNGRWRRMWPTPSSWSESPTRVFRC